MDFWGSRMHGQDAINVLNLFTDSVQFILANINDTIEGFPQISEPQKPMFAQQIHNIAPKSSICLHEVIREIQLQQPNAPAVHAWDGELTYSELHSSASQLSHELVRLGVGPEKLVGVCMDKSAYAAIAILSILQAGGVVVPLGVEQPINRIQRIVADAAVSIILTDEGQAQRLNRATSQILTINANLLGKLSPSDPTSRACSTVTPENAAWIVFTSGSTGIPKGSVLEHVNLNTSIECHGKWFGFSPKTRTLQFAAHTFDVAIQDFITTLCYGGCICIPSEHDRRNDLIRTMNEMRVNFAALTPTVATLITPKDAPTLRTMVLVGEVGKPAVIEAWLEHATLFNGFGPSECAIYNAITKPLVSKEQAQEIGLPVGVAFWLVDPSNYNRLSPPGAPGELVIEGPHLGRGYLNDPEKTANAFITDPEFVHELGLSPGRRMYRSGDLVRMAPNGSLTFLSRRDTQIKINGQRVEIGEVESHILAHPAVHNAIVVKISGGPMAGRLATAVTLHEFKRHIGAGPEIEEVEQSQKEKAVENLAEVRDHLSQHVMQYMIPTYWIPLASLPINASAKVDRMRLVRWISELDSDAVNGVSQGCEIAECPPTNATERIIRDSWAEAMDLTPDQTPCNRSFLSLGGDSVTAMKVVSACRKAGVSLDVRAVLQCRSVTQLALNTSADSLSASQSPNSRPSQPKASLPEADVTFIQERILSKTGASQWSDVENVIPCSPIQQGFLLSQMKDPNTYKLTQLCRVRSVDKNIAVDQSRLAGAWEQVQNQHSILRTVFTESLPTQQGFFQIVLQNVKPVITFLQSKDEQDMERLITAQPALDPFGSQPAHRFTIIRNADGALFCHFEIIHALIDAASVHMIVQGILKAYEQPLLEDHRSEYSQYVSYLQTQSSDDDLEYWKSRLAGLQPCRVEAVGLATELAAKDIGTKSRLKSRSSAFRLLHRLREIEHVTTASVFQLAWALLLSSYTNSDQVCFGFPSSGRNLPIPDAHKIVGPMINMLICSMKIERDMTVSHALHQMQDYVLEASQHQSISLASIQHEVQGNQAVLFNSTFSYERKENTRRTPGSSIVLEPVNGDDVTEFPIGFHIAAGELDIDFTLNFSTSLLSPHAASRLLINFEHIVNMLCRHKDAPIGTLSLLSENDKSILRSWNGDKPSRMRTCVHRLVCDSPFKKDDAPAIDAWDGQMTYGELEKDAARLAHHLLSLAVKSEQQVMIGLYFKKSKFSIVSILAILMCGGVVVPLSTRDPRSRLEAIIGQTAAQIILTDSIVQAERIEGLAPNVITVDEALFGQIPLHDRPPRTETTSDDLAWVMFTSGSTGIPKGVMLEHGAISTVVTAQARKIGSGPHTRRLQFAAFTFDVSLVDIFTTLSTGGCVCVPSEEDRLNNLAGFITSKSINFAQLTSTVIGMLDPVKTPIKELIFGGEAVNPTTFKSWIRHSIVRNGYGPAEATITAAHSDPLSDEQQFQMVGRPLVSNFWLVNPNNFNELCPIGVTGELLIEAPTLARGYLHDAKKTAAAFVTDPAFIKRLGLSTGRRMYRTSDLAKQNEDGTLTFVGRRDTQVKIRGQRVEIGEIEAGVRKLLPNTRGVVVDIIHHEEQPVLFAAIEFSDTDQHIRAAELPSGLLPASEHFSEIFGSLQSSLFDTLPAYMIPGAYLPMRRLPLNNSGKLDRKALKELLQNLDMQTLSGYLSSGMVKLEPSTEIERRLQALWASVLNRPIHNIGANDHFFQAGGDSVIAMRMVAVSRYYQVPLTVADIFTYPKLKDLARRLESQSATSEDSDVAAFSLWNQTAEGETLLDFAGQCGVEPQQIEDVYPCTPLQEGLMAITAQRTTAYTMQRVFRLDESIDMDQFKTMLDEITLRFAIFRTRIVPTINASAVQVVLKDSVEWITETSLPEYLTKDRNTPVLYGGPLCRLAIVTESSQRYFVWTMHHSIYDGWSYAKVMECLSRLVRNEQVPAPIPMNRFVRYLGDQNFAETRAYWQKQLTGVTMNRFPAILDGSYQPDPAQHIEYRMERARLPGKHTVAMVLRAAWAMLVAAHTGSDETVINVVLSGRTAPISGILDLIGPTVTTVPLRVPIREEQSALDLFSQLQQQATEMIPYEQTGLQNIRHLVPGLGSNFDAGHTFTVQAVLGQEDGDSSGQYHVEGMHSVEVNGNTFHSYPLIVSCAPDNENRAVLVRTWFDEKILPTAKVKLLLRQFEHIFHQLLAVNEGKAGSKNDSMTIKDVDLVSSADLKMIQSFEYNKPVKSTSCIHEVVRERAKKQPNAPAVCAWDGNLTYGELDTAASTLAHHLVGRFGVGPRIIVGMCMNKSKFAVIAILAILQAGGVVVPLGVQHPVQRIASIAADTEATLVLADEEQSSRIQGAAQDILVVDAPLLADLPAEVGTACSSITADCPAWIIFTSGSTGKPKGVVLEHHGICTICEVQGRLTKTDTCTRRLQFAAYTFDVSIGDTFTTFTYGGCLCVPSEDDRMNNLAGFIRSTNVNFLYLTSTVAGLLKPEDVPSVKTMTLGGEPVSPVVLERWLPTVTIRNAYGPAESCITAFHTPPVTSKCQAPYIGHPLASRPWLTSISDPDRLVPVGTPGEILIEGPTISSGYFKDEAKTNAAFIFDPAFLKLVGTTSTGRRMYRSGDLARQNLDGSLTIIGRRDTQIKIRGQRVETSEIEGWIVRLLPDVRVAYVDVILRGGDNSQAVLMAALSFTSDTGDDKPVEILEQSGNRKGQFKQLQERLTGVLPPFMIPSVYIPLSRLPLNASCKLDRIAIRSFLASLSTTELSLQSPGDVTQKIISTEMEAVLSKLWSKILGIGEDQVGRDDNIFHLGGDSIVAMKLVAAARAQGLHLAVADVFKNPKLADMALSIKVKAPLQTSVHAAYQPFSLLGSRDVDDLLEKLVCPATGTSKAGITDIYPVTDFQAQTIASNLSDAHMEMNFVAWDGGEVYNLDELKRSAIQLIDEIECLRTTFVFDGSSILQVVLAKGSPDMVQNYVADESIESFTDSLMRKDMHRPPRVGMPLLDIAIISSRSTARHRLLFRFSHAIYGGPTLPMIWEAFQALYSRKSVKKYTPFSYYISDIRGQIGQAHLDYWRNRLSGASMPRISRLPAHVRLPSKVHILQPRRIQVGGKFPEGVTTAVILKAAWGMVLAKHTASSDVVFADGISGRNAVGDNAVNALGCSVSGLPVRVSLMHAWTIEELLCSVRDQQIKSSEHEAFGFQHIFDQCTKWPRGTNFTSYVNHRQGHRESYRLGKNAYTPSFVPSVEENSLFDVTVTSHWTTDPNDIEITLRYAADHMSRDSAEGMLAGLFDTLELILKNPRSHVCQVLSALRMLPRESALPTVDLMSKVDDAKAKRVRAAWKALQKEASLEHNLEESTDWINAARVVSYLRGIGVKISVEDAYRVLISS